MGRASCSRRRNIDSSSSLPSRPETWSRISSCSRKSGARPTSTTRIICASSCASCARRSRPIRPSRASSSPSSASAIGWSRPRPPRPARRGGFETRPWKTLALGFVGARHCLALVRHSLLRRYRATHASPLRRFCMAGPQTLSNTRENNLLRTMPEDMLAQRAQLLAPFRDGEKMIARKLTDLAGKANAAVGNENLGLAQPAGVQEDLAGSRIAGLIFIRQAKIEGAERNPAGFPAPSHVDDALAIGQQRFELGACLRGGLRLPPRDEGKGTGLDADEGQAVSPRVEVRLMRRYEPKRDKMRRTSHI